MKLITNCLVVSDVSRMVIQIKCQCSRYYVKLFEKIILGKLTTLYFVQH